MAKYERHDLKQTKAIPMSYADQIVDGSLGGHEARSAASRDVGKFGVAPEHVASLHDYTALPGLPRTNPLVVVDEFMAERVQECCECVVSAMLSLEPRIVSR